MLKKLPNAWRCFTSKQIRYRSPLQQHQKFPIGLPSSYCPDQMLLNISSLVILNQEHTTFSFVSKLIVFAKTIQKPFLDQIVSIIFDDDLGKLETVKNTIQYLGKSA